MFSVMSNALLPESIEFLTERASHTSGHCELYRVLFTDDPYLTAQCLDVNELAAGNRGIHRSDRPTSWMTCKRSTQRLIADDEIDEKYAVAVKAIINRKSILLNAEDLSARDKQRVQLLNRHEVIVAAGQYPILILEAIDRDPK